MDIHRYPWISRILFVTKWHAGWVETISTRLTSMICSCASLQCFRFSSLRFCCYAIWLISLLFWEQLWTTKDHFGGQLMPPRKIKYFLFKWLSRNPQTRTINFSNVSCDSSRWNDMDSMRNRSPIISSEWRIHIASHNLANTHRESKENPRWKRKPPMAKIWRLRMEPELANRNWYWTEPLEAAIFHELHEPELLQCREYLSILIS